MSRRRALILAIVAIACSWGAAQLGPLSLLMPFAVLVAALRLSRAKQLLAAGMVLALSPFSPPAGRPLRVRLAPPPTPVMCQSRLGLAFDLPHVWMVRAKERPGVSRWLTRV